MSKSQCRMSKAAGSTLSVGFRHSCFVIFRHCEIRDSSLPPRVGIKNDVFERAGADEGTADGLGALAGQSLVDDDVGPFFADADDPVDRLPAGRVLLFAPRRVGSVGAGAVDESHQAVGDEAQAGVLIAFGPGELVAVFYRRIGHMDLGGEGCPQEMSTVEILMS